MEEKYKKLLQKLSCFSVLLVTSTFLLLWTLIISYTFAKVFGVNVIYHIVINSLVLLFEVIYYCSTYASISHVVSFYKFTIITAITFWFIPFLTHTNPSSLTTFANCLTPAVYFLYLNMRGKLNNTYLVQLDMYEKIIKSFSSGIIHLSFTSILIVFAVPALYLMHGFIIISHNKNLFEYLMQCVYAYVLGCLWASNYEIVDAIFSKLENVIRKDGPDEATFISKAINSENRYIQALGYERLAMFGEYCIHSKYKRRMDAKWLIASWRFFLERCEKRMEEYAGLLNKVIPAMYQRGLHPRMNFHKRITDADIGCKYIQKLHDMAGIICPCIITIKEFNKLKRVYLNIEEYPFFAAKLNDILITLIQIEVLLHALDNFKKEMASDKESAAINMDKKILYSLYKISQNHTCPYIFSTLESSICTTIKSTASTYFNRSLNRCPTEKLYVSTETIINKVDRYRSFF